MTWCSQKASGRSGITRRNSRRRVAPAGLASTSVLSGGFSDFLSLLLVMVSLPSGSLSYLLTFLPSVAFGHSGDVRLNFGDGFGRQFVLGPQHGRQAGQLCGHRQPSQREQVGGA